MKARHGILVDRLKSYRDVAVGTLPFAGPKPDEILISSEACSLNFPDLLIAEGKYQHKPPLPFFLGRDVVGRVLDIGKNVSRFKVGQRIAAQPIYGAFADIAVSPETQCFAVPEKLDPHQGAALGTVYATVIVALNLRGKAKKGERILITGAAGGVGSAAIQYAKFLGTEVVALVSSERKADAAKRMGADLVVRTDQIPDLRNDLRGHLQANGVNGVDLVIDVVGGVHFDATIRTLRPEGRLVVVGFASGQIPNIAANYLLLKGIAVMGSAIQPYLDKGDPRLTEAMQDMYRAASEGRIHIDIDSVFPFSEFASAAERLSQREVVGKIVLVPD